MNRPGLLRMTSLTTALCLVSCVASVQAGATVLPIAAHADVFYQRTAVPSLVVIDLAEPFTGSAGSALDGRVSGSQTWSNPGGELELSGTSARLVAPATQGEATVATGHTAVAVSANVTFGATDRNSGVVLHDGAAGQLLVTILDDGSDDRAVLWIDLGSGPVSIANSDPLAGHPSARSLQVTSRLGQVQVWVDDVQVIDYQLTGGQTAVLSQGAHGFVLGSATDELDAIAIDAWVG